MLPPLELVMVELFPVKLIVPTLEEIVIALPDTCAVLILWMVFVPFVTLNVFPVK